MYTIQSTYRTTTTCDQKKFVQSMLTSSFMCLVLMLQSCTDEEIEWVEVPLEDNVYFSTETTHRTDTIEIPIFAGADLEYKLSMNLGNAVSYNWRADSLPNPNDLLVEFHGHTIRTGDAPGDVMFYKRAHVDSSEGYLVAPFDGIHGWYFSNESNNDINIILNLSGFYELQ